MRADGPAVPSLHAGLPVSPAHLPVTSWAARVMPESASPTTPAEAGTPPLRAPGTGTRSEQEQARALLPPAGAASPVAARADLWPGPRHLAAQCKGACCPLENLWVHHQELTASPGGSRPEPALTLRRPRERSGPRPWAPASF